MNKLLDLFIGTNEINIIINIAFSLIAGFIIAASYVLGHKDKSYSKNFTLTVILLPVVVVVVIPLIATDLKKAVSLAGIFTLVRFRSVPGDSKDILYIFFSLTVGVAISLGYYIASLVLIFVFSCVFILLERKFNIGKDQILKITIPEDMDFNGIFDDIFEKYLTKSNLIDIKTSNMGSLFTVSYAVNLKNKNETKNMMDEIRTRNCNLNVVLQLDPDSIIRL